VAIGQTDTVCLAIVIAGRIFTFMHLTDHLL